MGGRQILEIYKILIKEQNKFINSVVENFKEKSKNNQNKSEIKRLIIY